LTVAVLLTLAGAMSRWRHRDRLRAAPEVPRDLSQRFLTRFGIVVGLVLVTLVVAATYYGSQGSRGSVLGVAGSPLTWAIVATLWAVVLWQVVRGRLAPYPGGWSGVTTCAILWIFPVGPVVLAFLATALGRLVDWDHVPGKVMLPYLLLSVLYLAVPVTAFRQQNRRRHNRSVSQQLVWAPAGASS
jgi:hypothetical protein